MRKGARECELTGDGKRAVYHVLALRRPLLPSAGLTRGEAVLKPPCSSSSFFPFNLCFVPHSAPHSTGTTPATATMQATRDIIAVAPPAGSADVSIAPRRCSISSRSVSLTSCNSPLPSRSSRSRRSSGRASASKPPRPSPSSRSNAAGLPPTRHVTSASHPSRVCAERFAPRRCQRSTAARSSTSWTTIGATSLA